MSHDEVDAEWREWIDTLEDEKAELGREIERLRPFEPENARLEEALNNAETNSIIATTLSCVGGFLVGYATFTGKSAESWANIAAGCLLTGVVILLAQSIRRRR